MLKIGETVRFLNSVGGGIIKRIDEKQNLVYVEDEDGFEVPALIREVVVVGPVNETTNFPRKDFSSKPVENVPQQTEIAPEPIQVKEEIPIVETADGDTLKVLLAFFPDDIKRLQECGYECYLVNDSNYFLFYNLVIGEDGNRKSVANGMIEPNIQEWISDIRKEQLNDWENVRIQLLPLKKDKVYQEQNVLDFMLKINPVKFYKLHSFVETDYFDDPCMLFDLVEMNEKKQLTEISPEKIKEAMLEKSPSKAETKISFKKPAKQEIIEVDLHINSLLDTTAGMSNADMLNHQMEVFHKTLAENKKRKGQKIVFIHGKGEGVLRKEIEKELKQKYKNYYFQDASFREYGFGATMVTIK
ncbi:MAG: DUF2027 domain-containing protein [Porphyromonadaceae bacterium]|nr:DUF2027 domain-containing protein [Porphyromonadaceae bacterium]